MDYDAFIAEWNGRQVTKFGGQCVALIAEFEAEVGRPIVYGDAAKWANHPLMNEAYDWEANNPADPNQLPPRGAIVVWGSDLPYTGGAGHIAFFDHNLGNHEFMSFGQNSGGPTAHFQPHSWNHVAGWYKEKQAAPAPVAPAPEPVPEVQIVHPYTIENINAKAVRINKPTHQWGMNYDNFEAMTHNVIRDVAEGEVIVVTAICHHNLGTKYYMPDANNASGYNIVDCEDVPVAVEPPAPPEPRNWPTAPVMAPNITDQYEVVKGIKGYMTANNAVNRFEPIADVPEGHYYVFNRKYDMVNVTLNPQQPGWWIHPGDNVVIDEPVPEPAPVPAPPSDWTYQPTPPTPPEPTATPEPEVVSSPAVVEKPNWRSSYQSFRDEFGEIKSRRYVMMRDYLMKDLDTKQRDYPLQNNWEIVLAGTFVGPDDVIYGRPQTAIINHKGEALYSFYGIPMDRNTIRTYNEVYSTETHVKERQAIHTLHPRDYPALVLLETESVIKKVWDIFQPRHKKIKK